MRLCIKHIEQIGRKKYSKNTRMHANQLKQVEWERKRDIHMNKELERVTCPSIHILFFFIS